MILKTRNKEDKERNVFKKFDSWLTKFNLPLKCFYVKAIIGNINVFLFKESIKVLKYSMVRSTSLDLKELS